MKTINGKTHFEIAAELINQVRIGGLNTSELAEMVWDTFVLYETAQIGKGGDSGEVLFGCEVTVTDINDGGVEMQVPYLLDRGVELGDVCGALGLPRDFC